MKHIPASFDLQDYTFVQADRSNISVIQLERKGGCGRGGTSRIGMTMWNTDEDQNTLTNGKEKIQIQTSSLSAVWGFSEA